MASTSSRSSLAAPLVLVVLGLGTLGASFAIERGFFHGMFLGMTIVLMALAAYLFGRSHTSGARGSDQPLWRPSEDDR